MLTALIVTFLVVTGLGYALSPALSTASISRRPYNNRYSDAPAARRDHLG